MLVIMTTVQKIEFCFENSRNVTRNVSFYYPAWTLFEEQGCSLLDLLLRILSGNNMKHDLQFKKNSIFTWIFEMQTLNNVVFS